jgi:hypothetical protein
MRERCYGRIFIINYLQCHLAEVALRELATFWEFQVRVLISDNKRTI